MSGNLLRNLLLFGRLLRGLGLDVSPGRMIDLVEALGYVDIGRKADFYHAARSLLVHRHEDIALFDDAFDAFWRRVEDGRPHLDGAMLSKAERRHRPAVVPAPLREREAAPNGEARGPSPDDDQPPILEATLTYSVREVLRHKDFAELTDEELAGVKRLMAELVWRLGSRRTRRRQAGGGPHVDLRRTVRRNLRYGGELLEWARREPKWKPRPLVILADISGSMERYARLLLQFVYSVTEGLDQRVEAFVFSTRLTRVTRHMRGRDVDRAIGDVARAVPDWSGGTRIGDAIKAFNFDWARRVLGRGAVVLLISDGWDRGDVDELRKEIARLQRSCHRLIWLNPLLGSPEYEPLTRGMQAALPFIDDFLPIHNLASLEDLADRLADLPRHRPVRTTVGVGGYERRTA